MKTLFKILLSFMLIASCSSVKRYVCVKEHDTMRVRYILDTITIEKPLLVIYGSDLCVIRESYLEDFISDPSHRPQGVGQQVFEILPGWIRSDVLNYYTADGREFTNRVLEQISFGSLIYDWRNYNGCVVYKESRGEIEVYEFVPEPSKFALELVYVSPKPILGDIFGDVEERIIQNRMKYLEKMKGKYLNKLDSLEISITLPSTSKYALTVEPLYSRETINKFIDDEGITEGSGDEERPHRKLSKRIVKREGLSDL